MSDRKKYDPPTESSGDHTHSLVRAALSAIPAIGGPATELFQKLLAPPIKRRQAEWMNDVAEGLRQVTERVDRTIEDLSSDDTFVDTIMRATQSAARNSQQEKREALRNAVLNAATSAAPDESRQQMFVNWIDELTVWHLRILKLLANPRKWYQENGKKPPEYAIAGSLGQMLCDAYPELKSQRDLYDLISADLYRRKLIGTDGLHTVMSGGGIYQEHATDLGKQFLAFVARPEMLDAKES